MSPNTKEKEFNKDELEAPAWLNQKFCHEVIKQNEKSDEIEIKNVKISPATAKGDHYASVMFRVSVDYLINGKNKTKSMILKTLPELEGRKKDLFGNSQIFETEIGIYTEVIPKFESILRGIGDTTVLGPPCLYHSLSPRKVIIFEDIVPMGYEVLRNRRITLEEIKAAYTKLAKWHAIGYKINLEDPNAFDKYRYSIFKVPNFTENDYIKNGISNFIEVLEEHADLIKFKKYFKALESKLIPKCGEAFGEYHENRQSDAIYVLCHGDFHIKNLMIKQNSKTGKCEDVMLLDYQMSYVGPIGNDIMYSIYMLLNEEERLNNLDELLFHYFTIFQETLQKLGFKEKIPKILQLRQELTRHKALELFLLTTFLPMWERFTDAKLEIDELQDSQAFQKTLYRDPKYVEQIRKMLPIYLHKGFLEY